MANQGKRKFRKKRMDLLRDRSKQYRIVPGMAFRELAASPENGREGQAMLRGRAPGCGLLDETPGMTCRLTWTTVPNGGAVDDRWVLVGNRFQLPSQQPSQQPKTERD